MTPLTINATTRPTGELTAEDHLRFLDRLTTSLAAALTCLGEYRAAIEAPLSARQAESRRRHEALAKYCEKMREQGLDLLNPRSPTGYNITRIAKAAGLANADLRRWLSGELRNHGAADVMMQRLFARQ
jgi:hypothetical protein